MTITTGVCRMYNHIQVTPPHSEAERTAALGATQMLWEYIQPMEGRRWTLLRGWIQNIRNNCDGGVGLKLE